MKLIVGLGNPGAKFKNTRHNLGYTVIDSYVRNNGLSWRYSQDWLGYFAKFVEFVLLKPSTFMNKSGESVRLAAEFFKISAEDILVIHDDLDLEFGKLRISFDSGSAGHKGVESVIVSLGGPDFARLRIGIGRPANKEETERFVLEEFAEVEKGKVKEFITKAEVAVSSFIAGGIDATKNAFN